MDTLFVNKECRLSREDSTLVITPKEGKKTRIPIHSLRHMVVAGEAGITSSLLCLLGRAGVRVSILDWHGNVTGTFEPQGGSSSGRVRTAQAAIVNDPTQRADMARRFVEGAGKNIIANLRYRIYRGNEPLRPFVERIQECMNKAAKSTSVQELMGHEGMMRAWYYDSWPAVDVRLDFGKRVRQPPNNPVNCLISWFNGLMYSLCRNELAKTHLDDCLAFLHTPLEARASLALDVSEVFKPAVCDTLIFECVLRNTDWSGWFHQEEGVCRLSEAGRRATLELWAARVDLGKEGQPSMRDIIRAECLAVERHVLGISTYTPWVRKV